MKKLIVISAFLTLASFNIVLSQDFQPNFLGDKFNLYKGVTVSINSKVDDFRLSNKFFTKVPKSETEEFELRIDNLSEYKNTKWKILSVDIPENRFASISDIPNHVYFQLKDINSEMIVYYDYSTIMDWDFVLLTEPIPILEKDFIPDIEKSVDDFTGEVSIFSPLKRGVGVQKNIKKGKSVTQLILRLPSDRLLRGKGVIILFSDGTKWSRPNEQIYVEVEKSGYSLNSIINLTAQDGALFQKKRIKKFRIISADGGLQDVEGDIIKAYMSIISKMK